jgi:hypothetical protein
LPGRQRRRFAGVGRTRAAIPGQGPHCYDFSLRRVFYANSRTWLLESLSKFYYKWVQSLRKILENCRKFRKMPNQFCWVQREKSHNFCYSHMAWFSIFLTWKIQMWKT